MIVAHPAGFADQTAATRVAEPVLRLEPWGRLDGTYLFNGEPTARHELLLEYGQERPRPAYAMFAAPIAANFAAYCLRTKRECKFSYPQVPPGRHLLALRVETKGWPAGNDGRVWRHQLLCGVDIRPSETTTVVVDGATDSFPSHRAPADLLP